jgi:hypothetical protein
MVYLSAASIADQRNVIEDYVGADRGSEAKREDRSLHGFLELLGNVN